MHGILSLWRSPLDKVALAEAQSSRLRQPLCSINYDEDFSAMTVYNFGYYVMNYPTSLDDALDEIFLAMGGATSPGGLAFIPQQNFNPVNASSGGFAVPSDCNIIGSGGGGSGGTSFFHFEIHGTGGLTFLNCSPSAYTTGGTYFIGLAFRWNGSTNAGDTCILAGAPNCRALRCTFTDCPRVFDAQAPGCALEQCTIAYNGSHLPDSATAVVITGSQCGVLGPGEFYQKPPNAIEGGGPQYCTCISVQGSADHSVIADLHISDWWTGVDFSQGGGSRAVHIRNCEIQSYVAALNVKLNGDGMPIAGLKVTSSTLARTNYSMDSGDSSPVVLIDPGGADNSKLSDITLLNCTVFNMGDASSLTGQHGLQIVGGTNLKVIGGTYSNNSPDLGAGIAITGTCGDVQIIGANLQPSYDDGTPLSTAQDQQFGLLVSANPTGTVLVSGCDMRGYMTPGSAVATSSVASNLFIYDCLGYSDQNSELNGNVPPTVAPGLNAAICSTPYFGPSVITFLNSAAVTLHVFGQHLTLSYGVVFLPSPYDSFYFSGPPLHFSWYGK